MSFLLDIKSGVNRGMQIRQSMPFFWPNLSIYQNFFSNPKPQPHPKTEDWCKSPGKRGHTVADTLLPTNVSLFARARNICC